MRNPKKGNAFRAEGPKAQKNRLAPGVQSAYTVEFGVSMLGTTIMIWGSMPITVPRTLWVGLHGVLGASD